MSGPRCTTRGSDKLSPAPHESCGGPVGRWKARGHHSQEEGRERDGLATRRRRSSQRCCWAMPRAAPSSASRLRLSKKASVLKSHSAGPHF